MKGIKIVNFSDFCFILTFAYLIFLAIGLFVNIEVNINGVDGKQISLLQWWTLGNENLKGFKLWLMLIGIGIGAFLIDLFITRKIIYQFTKEGKLEKYEKSKRLEEYLDDKSKKHN